MFAFGAVLYEMLTGERAFKGETAADTMTRHPHQGSAGPRHRAAGDLSRPRSHRPALSREVAGAALSVGQRSRVRARDALDDRPRLRPAAAPACRADARHRQARAQAGCRGRSRRSPVLAAAASWLPAGQRPRRRTAAGTQFTRISEAAGEETSPSLSPDGTTVAYAMRVNGSWDIYSQRVGGRNATPIVNDPQRDEGGAGVLARRIADRVSRVGR